jgi:hypothetical protein
MACVLSETYPTVAVPKVVCRGQIIKKCHSLIDRFFRIQYIRQVNYYTSVPAGVQTKTASVLTAYMNNPLWNTGGLVGRR